MDWQTAFSAVLSVLLLYIGWQMRIFWDTMKSIRKDVSDLDDKIQDHYTHNAETYVRRDDYRDDMAEIKTMLRQIFGLVNTKVDK